MKTTVIRAWPPIMKVSGNHIKVLLEVESTVTVKKKLKELGFDDCEYISTDQLVEKIKNSYNKEAFVTYEGKTKGSAKL
ncbi:hypothetical protein GBO34_00965 [Roseivirga pacifica]|uniref:hypothetical protein n=1 Tax=Roseivirga pacifica TaxID=1267423 RepID=UPI0020951F9A|nr:hypothetical protein [Roseivirga pacifica]MCO6367884.1 hypothetical protein [Roseivirga pacifica]MCO6377256.1 hypothetical protein [Roseivirga pacifica]